MLLKIYRKNTYRAYISYENRSAGKGHVFPFYAYIIPSSTSRDNGNSPRKGLVYEQLSRSYNFTYPYVYSAYIDMSWQEEKIEQKGRLSSKELPTGANRYQSNQNSLITGHTMYHLDIDRKIDQPYILWHSFSLSFLWQKQICASLNKACFQSKKP